MIRHARRLLLVLALSGCAASPPDTGPAQPLVLAANEVPLDGTFRVSIIEIATWKSALYFFFKVRSTPDGNELCTLFLHRDGHTKYDLSSIDLLQTPSSGDEALGGSVRFDPTTSIFGELHRGDKIDFANPNNKARCFLPPAGPPIDLTQAELRLTSPQTTTPVTVRLGIVLDTISMGSMVQR